MGNIKMGKKKEEVVEAGPVELTAPTGSDDAQWKAYLGQVIGPQARSLRLVLRAFEQFELPREPVLGPLWLAGWPVSDK